MTCVDMGMFSVTFNAVEGGERLAAWKIVGGRRRVVMIDL